MSKNNDIISPPGGLCIKWTLFVNHSKDISMLDACIVCIQRQTAELLQILRNVRLDIRLSPDILVLWKEHDSEGSYLILVEFGQISRTCKCRFFGKSSKAEIF